MIYVGQAFINKYTPSTHPITWSCDTWQYTTHHMIKLCQGCLRVGVQSRGKGVQGVRRGGGFPQRRRRVYPQFSVSSDFCGSLKIFFWWRVSSDISLEMPCVWDTEFPDRFLFWAFWKEKQPKLWFKSEIIFFYWMSFPVKTGAWNINVITDFVFLSQKITETLKIRSLCKMSVHRKFSFHSVSSCLFMSVHFLMMFMLTVPILHRLKFGVSLDLKRLFWFIVFCTDGRDCVSSCAFACAFFTSSCLFCSSNRFSNATSSSSVMSWSSAISSAMGMFSSWIATAVSGFGSCGSAGIFSGGGGAPSTAVGCFFAVLTVDFWVIASIWGKGGCWNASLSSYTSGVIDEGGSWFINAAFSVSPIRRFSFLFPPSDTQLRNS